jgi:hypothetical protein
VPKLTGTGRIADDLYLLAHDDVTGKPFLQSRPLGIGLAGALLAEQMFSGAIWLRTDQIQLTYRGLPADALGRHVLSLIEAELDRHPLRDWLTFLGATAEENVAQRLERSGYVTEANSRLPWRKRRWVPADSDCAFAPPHSRQNRHGAQPPGNGRRHRPNGTGCCLWPRCAGLSLWPARCQGQRPILGAQAAPRTPASHRSDPNRGR